MQRVDGRAADELRPLKMQRDYLKFAEGSVLIEVGTPGYCVAPVWKKKCRRFSKAAAVAG